MSRTRRSARTLAGVAGAAALTGLLLSGCGTGQISQTSRQVAAVNGANATVGSVDLRDVQVAYPTAPAGPDALYRQGGAAPLVATLVNTAPVADRLLSVTSPPRRRCRSRATRPCRRTSRWSRRATCSSPRPTPSGSSSSPRV